MKRFALLVSMAAVIAVSIWAYNVNYRTRLAFDRLDGLRRDLGAEREAVQVLRVEWAWLNAPGRLKRLVAMHHDRLELSALEAERYSFVATVPYPPAVSLDERMLAELADITNSAEAPQPEPEEPDLLPGWPLPPVRPAAWSAQ